MKASEMRKLSPAELDAKLIELKDELFNLRFQQAINQLDNAVTEACKIPQGAERPSQGHGNPR